LAFHLRRDFVDDLQHQFAEFDQLFGVFLFYDPNFVVRFVAPILDMG
jgi:hypothetical protein